MKALTVYPQQDQHDTVYIVGETSALISLKGALETAILDGGGESDFYVHADGEGFGLKIINSDLSKVAAIKRAVPYCSIVSRETSSEAHWPWAEEPR